MSLTRYTLRSAVLLLFLTSTGAAMAQTGFDLDIKKPEPYENRELRAEKSSQKKFTKPRRFFQNTYTHYNYFFNANTNLNEILDRAKASHIDDYTELLPFYNYDPETVSQQSGDLLDSVIHKSKTGIVLHDLRNDWIDDLYLLWGTSYYLKQHYDSAYGMFQFINYAFAEKEKDGYYRYIGSRMDGNSAMSVATVEKDGLLRRMVSDPPSRNAAFIWQVRTLIQKEAYPEAGSLIAILKNDPNFPKRLQDQLEEVQALLFYKQQVWDSAAFHLIKALDAAKSKQERARWEYLAAQLLEKKGLLEHAKDYYSKAINHTTDPVLDIHSRLNLVKINKDGGETYVDKNIAELLKMAKRDKYEEYRDVIYAMAAQMEIERKNFSAAQNYLSKAAKYKKDNVAANNKAYIQLADLAYERGDYTGAASFYDSVKFENLPTPDAERITEWKTKLGRYVKFLQVIERQDSLQRLAAMPETERTALIKKQVRQLRKDQGLKEEEPGRPAGSPANANPPSDLFATQQQKGEWYFNNKNLQASGATAFRQVWGNRPNVDNWRRGADVSNQLRRNMPDNTRGTIPGIDSMASNTAISFESLLSRVPLTPERMQASNDSIRSALFELGAIAVNDLEDYSKAVEQLETLRSRFTSGYPEAEALFLLFRSYTKLGNAVKAAEMKRLLQQKHAESRYATIITTGQDPQSQKPATAVTKTYEGVYDLFLEGKFEEAKQAKKLADSTYQTNYWSPQLLYIEAVYHIKQREDSTATATLNTLIAQNGGTPIADKAQNLVQVLSRRKQIEEELAKLEITRPVEDTLYVEPMPIAPAVARKDGGILTKPKDSLSIKPVIARSNVDSALKKPATIQTKGSLFSFIPDAPQYVAVVLNKVDAVFINEARNAFNRHNKERFYNQPLETKLVTINDDIKLLLIGNFTNAQGGIDYIQKTKPIAASQIVPWLKGDKFTFSLISEANLNAVLETKEFSSYEKFLEQNLPVKF
jgi:lipopolysaccharide biosynthesis regulator YciM